MNVATSAVTFVPYGTVTEIVLAFSSMVPVAGGLVIEKAVMALAELEAFVTVTVYCAVEPSEAVTVYATGLVKSFGVVPLTCTIFPTFTAAPVVVNVAIRAVTSVPYGTVTEMVLAFSSMTPVADGLVNEKAVMAFAPEGGVTILPPPPPPPPHEMRTNTTARNNNVVVKIFFN